MSSLIPTTATPNHALQRTRAAVTPAASGLRLSPAAQRSRQPRGSLSLGSLAVATRIVRTTLQIFLCAACFLAGACASQPTRPTHRSVAPATTKPTDTDTDTPFGQHPSSTVRGAARFGGGLMGAVVGIPATIALIPVTLPLSAATKNKWAGLVPFGASYYAGGAIFGGAVAPFSSPDRLPAAPATITRGERTAIETARRAVAERESWPHGAEFTAKPIKDGWAVTAWRIENPNNKGSSRFVPGGFRSNTDRKSVV